MKFICIRKNFWNGRLWKPGDTAEISQQDASASSVVAHFRPETQVEAPAPAEIPVGDGVPVVAAEAPVASVEAPAPAEAEAEGSTVREALKSLCLRNGIELKPRMSLKAMRDALAERGIRVN